VVDLLGLGEPSGLSNNFVPDPNISIFDTVPTELAVNPVLWQQYIGAADELALRVVSEDELFDAVVPVSLEEKSLAWIAWFGARAFRRPLQPNELQEFQFLFDEGAIAFNTGDPFEDGVRAAVTGFLASPSFLYRTEGMNGPPGELSGYELAAKLAFGLWNTMPDEELHSAVAHDGLEGSSLRDQAERMLDDPRGHAMVADLHRQLLHVDSYAQIWRESEEVLGIDVFQLSTPAAMQTEVYAYVDELVYSDGGVRELFTSRQTFANEAIADIYGIEGVVGDQLVPVELDPDERAGLLTMSGFLAWQAGETEPNLIRRGAFVNETLLCRPIPPPPADVPELPEPVEDETLRERIETHTSGCGGACHNDFINPVGFALGKYDYEGRYVNDSDLAIDATGSYYGADGAYEFDGAVDMAELMAEDANVHSCYVQHLSGYLEGTISTNLDEDRIADLAARSLDDESIRDLIVAIVTDPAFRAIRD
jgi:hypothetical protein